MENEELFNNDSPVENSTDGSELSISAPLAVRLRPRSLKEVIGHEHILGKNCLLPRLIKSDSFGSIILYGPPGCGKTTLAQVIAKETKSRFVKINAVLSNVAQLRDELRIARYRKDIRTILFIDEIHRFNKAQQDLLLPDVEEGNIILIGATTHNPGFFVIAPLLSRSHLFKLESLTADNIIEVLKLALSDKERGLGNYESKASDEILKALANICDGDMRRALNAIETLVLAKGGKSELTLEDVKIFAQERQIAYDSDEDEHYNTASAFIKSMRGCDCDAALYWMAKMLAGGEDPRFIARRLIILASEDIGLADSRALLIANAAFDACERVGLPECELNLAHAVIFLSLAPKSNSATNALFAVKDAVKNLPLQKVPLYLRDAHTKFNKSLGHGKEYIYNHESPEHISGQKYMEEDMEFYVPTAYGSEAQIMQRLDKYKKIRQKLNHDRQ